MYVVGCVCCTGVCGRGVCFEGACRRGSFGSAVFLFPERFQSHADVVFLLVAF